MSKTASDDEEEDNSTKKPLNSAEKRVQPVILTPGGEQQLAKGIGIREEDEERSASRASPDGGWRAWLVCFASFYANGALFGVINSVGVLYVKLKDKYGTDDEASLRISLVGSLAVGTTFLLSPVASILTDKFGIRKTAFIGSLMAVTGMLSSSFVDSLEMLYLTNGVLYGAGASLAYTPSLVILGHYFKRNLGIVNGIVTAGSSLFTIILPLLLKLTLETVGLKVTYQIIAALMCPLLACALIFKPLHKPKRDYGPASQDASPKSRHRCADCCNQIINTSIWKNKKYMVWAMAFPVSLFGYFVPYVHLVKHVTDILPGENGELLITCIGVSSGIGRIVFGKIADVPNVSRILLQQLSFFSLGVLTMLLATANAYWILVVLCLGLGLFDGCFISLLGPIAFDIVGTKGASQAIGFLLGLCSLPLTFGPPIAGWMYDHMGKNYHTAFLAAGVAPIVGSLLMFIIGRVKQPEISSTCEQHKLKPSITEETTISQVCENEEDAVWKLRPEFQKSQENGSPAVYYSNSLEDNQNSKVIPNLTKSTLDTEKNNDSEIFIEKQSTC